MPDHDQALLALCQLLDAATDAMWMSGLGYLGAATTELVSLNVLLRDPLAHWTDAEGQRVRQWVAEMERCNGFSRQEARARGMLDAARHVQRLVQHRLLRELGLRWPLDGYQLNVPQRTPGPVNSNDLPANHERAPSRMVKLIMRAPGEPTRVTEYDEEGETLREYTVDENGEAAD